MFILQVLLTDYIKRRNDYGGNFFLVFIRLYGITIIVGYLMPNLVNTYICDAYDLKTYVNKI